MSPNTEWSGLPLTADHVRFLDEHAVAPSVAKAAGLYSVTSAEALPEPFAWYGERVVPAIVFPWREPNGAVKLQLRPDIPFEAAGEDKPRKYVWPKDSAARLGEFRAVDGDLVLIVEGTKQALAAASYAPEGASVYGIAGCRMWSTDGTPTPDLMVCDDRQVVILLDSDASENLDVYEAGVKLAEAVRAEGARSVMFARLPGGKKAGLDDVLGARPADRRAAYLARLVEGAKPKPADAKPKPRRTPARASLPTTSDRPTIFVDGDRLVVINEITRTLLDRWNTTRLFNHGEVISQLAHGHSGAEMRVVTKPVFLDLLQETAVTARRGNDDAEPAYAWPDGQTVDAVMSRASAFANLDRVARAPFVRPDGSVCQVNGYDEATETMVVFTDDALARIRVPNAPTPTEVARARKLLVDDWLGDLPFHTDADRANALALVLTPFVRGQVGVVPLAVVDGLQMGVGKNLFADCVCLLATGRVAEPLPWTHDDEEVRKVITSAFRTGADVFVFDEAHVLDGAALARALTSSTYRDRLLGASQMLGFPNRVTWMSLGNSVRVEGDIVRRVYRIALRPNEPNPQDRPASSFRHPDLRHWTAANRPELLTAALTLVRAWFADGCPAPSRGVSFGSFEAWERVVGGIVERAGQPGFLDNLQEWRSETSFTAGYWSAHVRWLHSTFGGDPFTCAEVREALLRDPHSEPPPGFTDPGDKPRGEYNRSLGVAYARHRDRFFDGYRFVKDETGRHDHVGAWRVIPPGDLTVAVGHNTPDTGGKGGSGGDPTPSHIRENVSNGILTGNPDTHVSRVEASAEGSPATPLPPDGGSETEGDETPGPILTDSNETTFEGRLVEVERVYPGQEITQESLFTPHVEVREYPRIDLAAYSGAASVALPPGVVVFDLETDGKMSDRGWTGGPEFVRLSGYQLGDRVRVTTDTAGLARTLSGSRLVVGHNIASFDLVALARHFGLDIHALAADGRIADTMLTEILLNPPPGGMVPAQILAANSLDRLGETKFGDGKVADLKALAKEFGGFGSIPVDDERYVRYCAADVDLTARLAATQRRTPYVMREHRVAALAAQIRLNGFRVDVSALTERVEAALTRKREQRGHLYALGMPRTNGQGKPSTYPHRTKAGAELIERLFADLGVTDLPRTKTGAVALDGDNLKALAERYADRPEVLDLVEPIQTLNGVRTVYETALEHLKGDRVHPEISMVQASGRWSITEPGLTVFGKRGGRHREREIFVPEPGHVIISADLAQIDARAVAAWCQDPAYLDLFEPGRDSHTDIALAIWGDAGRRQDAKVIGHGWNYGMGLARLAMVAGNMDTARHFDAAMRDRFPKLVQWKRDVAHEAEGGLLDNGFGRKLRCTPGREWTQAPALMGQSTARDLMMEGLLRLPREVLPYLRAVVHDEIVLSIPEAEADDIERAVLDALAFEWAPRPGDRPVKIEAGLGERRGRNWGEVYEK